MALRKPGPDRKVEEPPRSGKESLGDFVRRVAGTAEGLPADLAENHDYYLCGTAKRVQR